jgi:hypothetical protein
MKLNNINPCIAGRYMLFSSNSTEPPRQWVRASSSGRSICCVNNKCNSLIQEKLKYTTLQYKQNNNGNGSDTNISGYSNLSSFISGNVQHRNYTRQSTNTLQIGNILYYIHPDISENFKIYIKNNYTPEQIKNLSTEKIKSIILSLKQKYNIPISKDVLLKNVPLSQFKKRYTYLTSFNNWHNDPKKKTEIYKNPLNFNIPYKVGSFITNTTILGPFDSSNSNNNNVFSIIYNLSFNNLYTGINDVQFLYVIQNNTCTYTGVSDYLFPAQNNSEIITSASFWGSSILSKTTIENFIYNKVKNIEPVFIIIQPGSWKVHCGKYYAKFGVLLSLYTFVLNNSAAFKQYYSNLDPTATEDELQTEYDLYLASVLTLTTNNSDLVFIPIQTQIGLLNNIKYQIEYSVNIPFVTDSIDTIYNNKDVINAEINKYFNVNNIHYKSLQPYQSEYQDYITYL